MPAAQAFVAHTPRFITAKEKLNSPARKCFELRHNIVRRDCAKHDGWSYTITVISLLQLAKFNYSKLSKTHRLTHFSKPPHQFDGYLYRWGDELLIINISKYLYKIANTY